MWLRDLVLKDFWLKLFSVSLAVLIWVTVSFAIHKENIQPASVVANLPTRVLRLPVLVVSAAADVREFHVAPDHIEVTVWGEAANLARLQDKDVSVMVDLTDIESARGMSKRVEVSTPPGITLKSVFPDSVQVVVPPKRQ
jgi:YbbR domain-containing protein